MSGKEQIPPTPERSAHGPVELIEKTISDTSGRPSQPYRAIDILGTLHRKGAITSGMWQAGEDFREQFCQAQLEPLRAADLSRPIINARMAVSYGNRVASARDSVWKATLAVGGIDSAAGSCIWHVIGFELPLKQWAIEQGWAGRTVNYEVAKGILISALGVLENHYHPRAIGLSYSVRRAP